MRSTEEKIESIVFMEIQESHGRTASARIILPVSVETHV